MGGEKPTGQQPSGMPQFSHSICLQCLQLLRRRKLFLAQGGEAVRLEVSGVMREKRDLCEVGACARRPRKAVALLLVPPYKDRSLLKGWKSASLRSLIMLLSIALTEAERGRRARQAVRWDGGATRRAGRARQLADVQRQELRRLRKEGVRQHAELVAGERAVCETSRAVRKRVSPARTTKP